MKIAKINKVERVQNLTERVVLPAVLSLGLLSCSINNKVDSFESEAKVVNQEDKTSRPSIINEIKSTIENYCGEILFGLISFAMIAGVVSDYKNNKQQKDF